MASEGLRKRGRLSTKKLSIWFNPWRSPYYYSTSFYHIFKIKQFDLIIEHIYLCHSSSLKTNEPSNFYCLRLWIVKIVNKGFGKFTTNFLISAHYLFFCWVIVDFYHWVKAFYICTVDENIIATIKILNDYVTIQSFIFPILR